MGRYILLVRMNYSKKDIITGFVIILIIVLGFYLYQNSKKQTIKTNKNTPVSVEYKKDFEDKFKLNMIDDSNTIELVDLTGGNSRGIASENEILVDADNPKDNYYYEAWLVDDNKTSSLGKLEMVKGGWLLKYSKNNLEAKKLIISLEKVDDGKIEKSILEGSFN